MRGVPASSASLANKLQIKSGHRVGLINAPPGYAEKLRPLPQGTEVLARPGRDLDVVVAFARDAGELERIAPSALKAVKPDGLLWVCYPKGGAQAGTDLDRDVLWELLNRERLVGMSLVAVDETWSAMRFRRAR